MLRPFCFLGGDIFCQICGCASFYILNAFAESIPGALIDQGHGVTNNKTLFFFRHIIFHQQRVGILTRV